MGKGKRAREDDGDGGVDNVHPSRQKRLKYTEEDAQMAKVYQDLANEVQTTRIRAAGEFLKMLSTKVHDRNERREIAQTRLIKGLCSGRKAARLGFSVALTELLRLRFKADSETALDEIALGPYIDQIVRLTTSEGNVSGQERRQHLIGRRFALQAILQSDVGLSRRLPNTQWDRLIRSIFALAAEKPWLRRECGGMLYEYLTSSSGARLEASRVQSIVDSVSYNNNWRNPEGVGLWITIQEHFTDVRLPKGIWHHSNPLSSKERQVLLKVLLENSTGDDSNSKTAGSRQSSPSFVWSVVLAQLYRRDERKPFVNFWENCVVSSLFSTSASTERKSLGLQIVSLALSTAPSSWLPAVLHPNLLRYIIDQRLNAERYLFDAAKVPLNQMVARSRQEPEVSGGLAPALLVNGAVNFDNVTKTKTIESIISNADNGSLLAMARAVAEMMQGTDVRDKAKSDTNLRSLADLLLLMVRSHKHARSQLKNALKVTSQSEESWLESVLITLARKAYAGSLPSGSATIFQSRLMSCLNCLMEAPTNEAARAPVFVVAQLKDTKNSAEEVIQTAYSSLHELSEHLKKQASSQAFSLLLALSVLQVYNNEPEAVSILEDVINCYHTQGETNDSKTMLIEVLLSFISKPSALFRKLAEQVFSVLASELTPESLQSLIDILGQKENLIGQRELFNEGADGHDGSGSTVEDEELNVEDASDVELVNGQQTSASRLEEREESDDDLEDSASSNDSASPDGDDDEEAVFDKKLANALGTAGIDDDSDYDGSDMDDEQMMALEPHLTSIFKERQQHTSKKQEKKDAKENIVNFKNRTLDLLMIYVKNQYASLLAVDLVLPLTSLVRTTTSQATAEKSFAVLKQYFDACSKNKSLPQPEDHDACFEVLASVHEEVKLGGSKLHAYACSRSSLFLSKVLVSLDVKYYERIAEMYQKLQSEWYLDLKSKIHGSVFTEWTSWSIATRKHA